MSVKQWVWTRYHVNLVLSLLIDEGMTLSYRSRGNTTFFHMFSACTNLCPFLSGVLIAIGLYSFLLVPSGPHMTSFHLDSLGILCESSFLSLLYRKKKIHMFTQANLYSFSVTRNSLFELRVFWMHLKFYRIKCTLWGF